MKSRGSFFVERALAAAFIDRHLDLRRYPAPHRRGTARLWWQADAGVTHLAELDRETEAVCRSAGQLNYRQARVVEGLQPITSSMASGSVRTPSRSADEKIERRGMPLVVRVRQPDSRGPGTCRASRGRCPYHGRPGFFAHRRQSDGSTRQSVPRRGTSSVNGRHCAAWRRDALALALALAQHCAAGGLTTIVVYSTRAGRRSRSF